MFKRKLKKKFGRKAGFFLFLTFISILMMGGAVLWNFYQKGEAVLISPISKFGDNFSIDEEKEFKVLLNKYNIPFSKISIASDSSYLVELQNGEKVLFSHSPTKEQLSSLQLILSRFTIEGKRFAFLDFRFDKPVVGFK